MKRLTVLLAVAAGALVAACGGGGGGSASSGGKVTIVVWHGQNQSAQKVFNTLTAEFNRTHPKIHVDAEVGAPADSLLEKVTAALAGGKYPDMAYIFGPNVANLARSPKALDLTATVKQPGWNWSDYDAPARAAVTVDGHVRAVPADIDSLAVVYNKALFKKAGVPFPKAGWTWDDFVATAKRLTNAGQGVFGVRMLIQWLSSERHGHSVIPIAFWYCSLIGGLTLFLYAVHLQAWPLVLGQGCRCRSICAISG